MITFQKRSDYKSTLFSPCQLYQTGDGLVTQKNEKSSCRKPLSRCVWAPTRGCPYDIIGVTWL